MTHKASDFSPFAIRIGLIWLLAVAIGSYPLHINFGLQVVIGFALAFTLTFFNALVGYFFIDKYFSASLNSLMAVVFASMGIRLGAMALLIVGVLVLTEIHDVGFTISLFISYILFSVIEIIYINKKASKPDPES